MQLLAGFFLNCFRVSFHSLYTLGIELVFLLFERDSLLQRFVFRPLLFVHNHSIRAQHHVHEKQASKRRNRNGRDPPPQGMDSRKNRPQFRHPRRSESLGLRALSATARKLSCGLGNRRMLVRFFTRKSIAWSPRSTLQTLLAARFRVHPHQWLGAGQTVQTREPSSKISFNPSARTISLTSCPQNSGGSDFNFSVDFPFTSGVKRKFSAADNRNQGGYIATAIFGRKSSSR